MAGDTDGRVSGVIGPNAVIQLRYALDELCGRTTAEAIFHKAGYPDLIDHPPDKMIDEAIPAALMAGVWGALPRDAARAVTDAAGRRTADYVIANRIPTPAKWLLKRLPPPLAARLLLKAVHRNAWTFCGSGLCRVRLGRTLVLTLANNPLTTPDCRWHVAVLERMFRELVVATMKVSYSHSRNGSEPLDRFEFRRA